MRINSKLKKYIENEILPEYRKNEVGHGIDHIKYVIDRSKKIVKNKPRSKKWEVYFFCMNLRKLIDKKIHLS